MGKSKSICPACGSWNREKDKEYDVIYEKRRRGLTGICLNPQCKAEWFFKSPIEETDNTEIKFREKEKEYNSRIKCSRFEIMDI